MRVLLVAALLSAALFYSGRQPAVAQGTFTIYAGDQTTTFDGMIDRLAQADAVFVGENHDHQQGHALELSILKGLADRHPNQALSLEMFERDTQGVVDEYLGGFITEQQFVASARPWPNYRTDYAPLVEFCREKHLPMIAANVPRRYVNIVSRKGQQALGELPKASKAYLPPLPYSMDLPPEYDRELTDIFGEQHGQAAGMPGMPTVEHMKEAQALWDVGMADSIARFLRSHRGWHVIQMNGAQHSDHGFGIVDRLRRMAPRLKVLVVSIKPDTTYPNVPAEHYRGLGDFVIVTPPAPEPASKP